MQDNQYAFDFGLPEVLRPTWGERLFFALMLEPEAALAVDRFGQLFRDEHGLDGRPLLSERLHLSLHSLGDHKRLRSKTLFVADRAAAAVALRRFEVNLFGITTFEGGRPDQHPLVLLAEGMALHELHRRLGVAISGYGIATNGAFTPHVTLSYGRHTIAPRRIEPFSVMVKEFCLVHNERQIGRRGIYHVLARWPLAA